MGDGNENELHAAIRRGEVDAGQGTECEHCGEVLPSEGAALFMHHIGHAASWGAAELGLSRYDAGQLLVMTGLDLLSELIPTEVEDGDEEEEHGSDEDDGPDEDDGGDPQEGEPAFRIELGE